MSSTSIRRTQRQFEHTQAQLDDRKRRARDLLEQLGVPTQPPPSAPVPRVRVRVLQERSYPGGGGRTRTVRVGDELVTEEANLQSYVESGFAELIGPAPPEPVPEPRPFGEVGQAPYFYWYEDVAAGKCPSEWEEWGIELPTEKDRPSLLAALWNAALVYSADFETRLAADAAYQARLGSPTVPPDEARGWPMDTLLMLTESFPPEDSIARQRKTRKDAQKAGGAEKYARGIQAAVTEVYRKGMTERECWEALREVDGEAFTVKGARYEFYLDLGENEIAAACETHDQTGRARSIKRTSFQPYFARARNRSRGSSTDPKGAQAEGRARTSS